MTTRDEHVIWANVAFEIITECDACENSRIRRFDRFAANSRILPQTRGPTQIDEISVKSAKSSTLAIKPPRSQSRHRNVPGMKRS